MPDDLTERIAEVLAVHQRIDDEPDVAVLCSCGVAWQITYLSDIPLRHVSHRRHQAEQVRAVLGETTTEIAVRYGDGTVEDESCNTVEYARVHLDTIRWFIGQGTYSADDYEPMTIVSREYLPGIVLTPWVEVPDA